MYACDGGMHSNGITPVAQMGSPGKRLCPKLLYTGGGKRPPLPLHLRPAKPPEKEGRGAGYTAAALKEERRREKERRGIAEGCNDHCASSSNVIFHIFSVLSSLIFPFSLFPKFIFKFKICSFSSCFFRKMDEHFFQIQ